MIKKTAFCLSLCASLYAYDENTFDISFLQGKNFDIQLYSSLKSNTSYGFIQTQENQYNFWGSAKKDEYYLSATDFGTCALKNTKKDIFEALCKINEETKEFIFSKENLNAKIYQINLKDQKNIIDENKTIEFDYTDSLLSIESKDKNLQKIIDDFNENLDKKSLLNKANQALKKWKNEEISNNEILNQVYVFYYDKNIISLGKNAYSYTGGAHGMVNFQRKTYDISNMKLIDIKNELMLEDNRFQNIILQKIKEKYSEDDLFDTKNIKMTSIYEVKKNGLIFIWEPYDIAPYSTGVIEIFVSFKELKPFWRKNSKLAYLIESIK